MAFRTRLLLAAVGAVVLLVVGVLSWTLSESDQRVTAEPGIQEFLEPWYEALADQREEPAKLVMVGDSITEGVLLPTPVVDHRVTGLLQDLLREGVGADGGTGYMPAYYADPTSANDTQGGGPAATPQSWGPWGLGGRSLLMPGGATLTYPTQPATSVRVWYGISALAGGHGKVFVDGVDVTARGVLSDGTGARDTIVGAAGENRSGIWWQSPPLGPGEHTVEVRSVVPGTAFVHTGVEFLAGDEDSGVHVYDAAHSGATTAHFADQKVREGHWTDIAAIEPQLVVINLGTNLDTDHLANLRTVVDHALEAAPRARVLLVDGYRAGTWDPERWEQVREDKRQVAEENADRVAVLDLASHWPELAVDGSSGEELMLEGELVPLHPSAEGHARMAEIYASLLTPP